MPILKTMFQILLCNKWYFYILINRHAQIEPFFGSSGALVIVGSHELWPQILKVHLSATVLYRWTGLFARPIKKEVPVEGIRVFLSYWPSWQHSSAVTFGFVGPGIIWFQTWVFFCIFLTYPWTYYNSFYTKTFTDRLPLLSM